MKLKISKQLRDRAICFLLSVAFALSLLGFGFTFVNRTVKADSAGNAETYYLGEDRNTMGLWYTGEKGTKEFAQNRVYGKSGVVLMYHGQVADGKDTISKVNPEHPYEDNHETFQGMKSAHYVEYASWISDIAGEMTESMWNNHQATLEEARHITIATKDLRQIKQLLYIDLNESGNPEHRIGSPCEFVGGGSRDYKITINDENWHIITLYIGSPYNFHYPTYEEMNIRICDISGKQLIAQRIKDTNKGVYVSFAVKGSVIISADGAGYNNGAVNGIFFDEMPENNSLCVENLSITRTGARTINLNWTNKADDSLTNIYRRIKGNEQFEYIATVGKGINSYVDTETAVDTHYEYTLTSGVLREYDESKRSEWDYWNYTMQYTEYVRNLGVKDFNVIDFTDFHEIATAPYKKTYIETAEETLRVAAAKEADDENNVNITFKLYKDSEFNADGAIKEKGNVYEGREISFRLDGENVYSEANGNKYENMRADFGKVITDSEGNATLSFTMIYPGDYTIYATVDEYEDETDPSGENGYDKYVKIVELLVGETETEEEYKPILTSITDAVKPGETVVLSGYYIKDDGELKIAYKKNEGDEAGEFNSVGASYLSLEKVDVVDNLNETALMFDLPKNLAAGVYDFYVHNKNGWSKGITLNAARPLFLDQEAAYEGQQIQINGRNFLLSEFGAGDVSSSYSKIAVKLTLIEDVDGNAVINGNTITLKAKSKNGRVLTEMRETKESALQYGENLPMDGLNAEAIPYSTEYKITFVTPQVMSYGTYLVSVANDGKYFVSCQEPTYLKIVEKVSQTWDSTVFGADYALHNGNDPLDLGVYWAQYLNYIRIETMTPNDASEARSLTNTLNQKIKDLNAAGGGVIYFPAGEFYLSNDVFMKSNVIIVGAGKDKTTLYYVGANATVWFRGNTWGESASSNVGFARLTLSCEYEGQYHEGEGWYTPDRLLNLGASGDYSDDIGKCDSENKFLIDVDYNGKLKNEIVTGGRQLSLFGAQKNVLLKNLHLYGSQIYNRTHYYTSCYNVWQKTVGIDETPIIQGKYTFIENSFFDMNQGGHGISIRSDSYVGYTLVTGTGNRERPTNDGEALLVEPPKGYQATGRVLSATERTITLDFVAGEKISDDSFLHYNNFAVCITDGKGAGQIRFIDRVGTGAYTNCYQFLSGEKDWDVIPDHTSVFTIYLPLNNLTVSHFKAYDCVATICLYYQISDAVVADCSLYYTSGIALWGMSSGGIKGARTQPSYNVRILRNEIVGTGANYNVGSPRGQGQGGIMIDSSGGTDSMGTMISNVVIKDNYLHDLIPSIQSECDVRTGITILSGDSAGTKNKNLVKYIVVENNTVNKSEAGLYVDSAITGIILKNNSISGTTLRESDTTILSPRDLVARGQIEFYVNGELSSLSGEYAYGELLPETAAIGGKDFYGWTTDQDYMQSSSKILTTAPVVNVKLYAVYGYKVTFDYNYLKSDGTEKGEYVSYKVLDGQIIADEVEAYGDPFRSGYTFGGWYKDKECTDLFNANDEVKSSLTVYAKWIGGNGEDLPVDTSQNEQDGLSKGAKIAIISSVVCLGVAAISVGAVVVIKKRKKL